MSSTPPGLAIFDLDGTLIDSLGDIQLAANRIREDHGLEVLDESAIAPLIGLPASALFHDSVDDIDKLVHGFRDLLGKITGLHTTIYPCVPEILSGFRRRGWKLAVATNKPTILAQTVLDRMGLLQYFAAVHGADGLPPKPDPAIVNAAIGVKDWPTILMIGDTTMDIRAGSAAGASTVAVTYGSHSRSQLAGENPNMIVETLCELAQLLGWHNARNLR